MVMSSLPLLLLACSAQASEVVVFSATPAGIAAAIAAKRSGAHSVHLLEETSHVGGRFAETIGFGEVHFMNPESVGGLWTELREKVDTLYGKPTASPEPHCHERLIESWLAAEGIQVWKDFRPVRMKKKGTRITEIIGADGRRLKGEVFVDASYYGDLLPMAGVSWVIGRESRAQHGESLAGVVLELKNPPGEIILPIHRSPISGFEADGRTLLPHVHGLTSEVREGDGDDHLQAANLYACLTRNPANRIPIKRPGDYDPREFELLRRELARLGEKAPFHYNSSVPGEKTKVNDGVNYLLHWAMATGADRYPAASPEERRRIWETHRGYTHRMLWFLQNDPAVPAPIRKNLQEWGLPKDEFDGNGHWPWGLYAREGRRMAGAYVMTQRDLFEDTRKPDVIAVGNFPVDSHVVRRLATPDGKEVVNEGGFLVKPPIYEIPYRALVPRATECTNLLVPAALSSTRVAFNSLRVEPTWMATGQAAGTAAAFAARRRLPVSEVPLQQIQEQLRRAGLPISAPARARRSSVDRN